MPTKTQHYEEYNVKEKKEKHIGEVEDFQERFAPLKVLHEDEGWRSKRSKGLPTYFKQHTERAPFPIDAVPPLYWIVFHPHKKEKKQWRRGAILHVSTWK